MSANRKGAAMQAGMPVTAHAARPGRAQSVRQGERAGRRRALAERGS